MKWRPFRYKGDFFDLSHLNPCDFTYIQPGKGESPKRYSVKVKYSLHCFTRKLEESDEKDLYYSDSRETRSFDFKRYKLSFKLPDIIASLGERECYHTTHNSFFTIEITDTEGQKVDYEIYFDIKKTNKQLQMYINSAYPRDLDRINNRSKKKKIRFYVILYNVLHNKKIRRPH